MTNAINDVIEFIQTCETPWSRDTSPPWGIHDLDPAPYNRLYGPVHARGPVSGVIFHKHNMLAAWGESHKADLTFSVAKTYLALLAGILFSIMAVCAPCLSDVFINHSSALGSRCVCRQWAIKYCGAVFDLFIE